MATAKSTTTVVDADKIIDEAIAEAEVTKAESAAPKREKDSQKKNRLRNEAERHILTKYRAELVAETERLFKDAGLEYTRRLTDGEKAEKAMEDLLANNPELAAKLAARLAPAETVEDSVDGPNVAE